MARVSRNLAQVKKPQVSSNLVNKLRATLTPRTVDCFFCGKEFEDSSRVEVVCPTCLLEVLGIEEEGIGLR